jgi:hypothetical protein
VLLWAALDQAVEQAELFYRLPICGLWVQHQHSGVLITARLPWWCLALGCQTSYTRAGGLLAQVVFFEVC